LFSVREFRNVISVAENWLPTSGSTACDATVGKQRVKVRQNKRIFLILQGSE